MVQATRSRFCQYEKPFSTRKLKQGSPSDKDIAWNCNSGLAFAVTVAFGLPEVYIIKETRAGRDSYRTRCRFVKDAE